MLRGFLKAAFDVLLPGGQIVGITQDFRKLSECSSWQKYGYSMTLKKGPFNTDVNELEDGD